MEKQEKVLAEIFRSAGRYILEGGNVPNFSGDKKQVEAIRNAMNASRQLYEALCDNSTNLDAVTEMIRTRQVAAAEFRRVIGREWRY